MSGGTARERQQVVDLAAPDHSPTCPTCGDLCPPAATRCECGERLQPRIHELPAPAARFEPRPMPVVPHGCTCGGLGICLQCVFAEYDGEVPRG